MSQILLNNVNTWYEEIGTGEPLLLLHPGGFGVQVFEPQVAHFKKHFHIYMPERRGHGHTADIEGAYSFQQFADDTITFIEKVIGTKTRIVGMSDGAIVGLLVAHKRPDLVERLVCAGGVFHMNGWDDGVLEPKETKFEDVFQQKLHDMHYTGPALTEKDLQNINTRTLVMVGDDDEPTYEHTLNFYKNLPHGELAVVPGTSHGLLVEKPNLCNAIILDFLQNEPVQTFAPRSRK